MSCRTHIDRIQEFGQELICERFILATTCYYVSTHRNHKYRSRNGSLQAYAKHPTCHFVNHWKWFKHYLNIVKLKKKEQIKLKKIKLIWKMENIKKVNYKLVCHFGRLYSFVSDFCSFKILHMILIHALTDTCLLLCSISLYK